MSYPPPVFPVTLPPTKRQSPPPLNSCYGIVSMILPVNPYLEHLERAISVIPQQPHHRRAVQIIANEVDLTKHDICHRPLLFVRSNERLNIPCDIISLADGPIGTIIFVPGEGGVISRFGSPFHVITGEDAEVIRDLVREFREVAP
jgi:hypothetical protein